MVLQTKGIVELGSGENLSPIESDIEPIETPGSVPIDPTILVETIEVGGEEVELGPEQEVLQGDSPLIQMPESLPSEELVGQETIVPVSTPIELPEEGAGLLEESILLDDTVPIQTPTEIPSDGIVLLDSLELQGFITDHGELSGLDNDDHLLYLTISRGDIQYLSKTNTLLYIPTSNYHPATKKYVDDSTGTVYTFDEGLTELSGNVDLGGLFDSEIIINSVSSNFWVKVGTINYQYLLIQSGQSVIGYLSGGNVSTFTVTPTSIHICDEINSKGVVYTGDYSTNWTDHSLVTKKWVTDNFGPGNDYWDRTGTVLHTKTAGDQVRIDQSSDGYLNFDGTIDIRDNAVKIISYGDPVLRTIRFGEDAGNDSMTVLGSIYIGYQAGFSITDAIDSILIGCQTGANILDGDYNIAIGRSALFTATTGYRNVAIGPYALYKTNSNSNVGIGTFAGRFNVGSGNFFLGYYSGYGNNVDTCSGFGNVGIGVSTLAALTEGYYNIAIGSRALSKLLTSDYNTTIGGNAGRYSLGGSNVFIGYQAGQGVNTQTDGAGNTFIGYLTGNFITTGNYNVLIGWNVNLAAGSNSCVFRLGRGTTYILEGNTTTASEWIGSAYEARFDEIVEYTGSAGVTIEGILIEDSFIDLVEVTAPGTPASNHGYLYLDSADGILKLKDDGGTAHSLW